MRYILFAALLVFFCNIASAQRYTLSGHIKDTANGESLIGANIYIKEQKAGIVTNLYGFYSVTLPKGNYTLTISYIGYQSIEKMLDLTADQTLNFLMQPVGIVGKEVVITEKRSNENVAGNDMSRVSISSEKIKSLPVVFGESDVLKAITLLPGIKSGGEGNTGFYVRGGGPDQNLVLLDEAVIYNPSHLLGFFSVFNSDAIKNAEIIKGAMPAKYGGRLSSIVNVTMKEGNNQKFQASGGVGLIASRFAIEGPIKKNKSSFIFSARRTYIDVLVKPFLADSLKGNGYYFYDFNFKANYVFSDRDRIYISGYYGIDKFTFTSPDNRDIKFNINWGNSFISSRWNHVFTKKLFANTSLIYNRFDLATKASFGIAEFTLLSGLKDWNLKSDWQYYPSIRHNIRFGVNYTYHTFIPGIASGRSGSTNIKNEIDNQYAHEAAVYLSDDWDVTDKFGISAGLRYSIFNQVGPYERKLFQNDGTLTDSVLSYKKGESIALYGGLEPRFALRYNLGLHSSLKGSVTKTFQYLHLATSSAASLPTDLWVPSSALVQPQVSLQYALGYFRNFKKDEYESSVELYYKTMENQIEFKPGAQLFFNQNLESEMVFGSGLSYGAEFFFKKTTGKTNGWIGYTWSKTTRTFNDLNNGKSYYYRYDRRHDVSFVLSQYISRKWSASFVFVYGSGNFLTLPNGRFLYFIGYDNTNTPPIFSVIDRYDEISNYRMQAYHRADISFTYQRRVRENYESSWNFSAYNLYNRKNPYFIYFDPDIAGETVKSKKVYLFPIIPSVTWNFKFK